MADGRISQIQLPDGKVYSIDEKIKLTEESVNNDYPIIFGPASITSDSTYQGYYNEDITINPSTESITATNFVGTLNGTATGNVPNSRTINGKSLGADVTLIASDVGAATSNHVHGNITNDGNITATAPTIASGDRLVINDSSASKITNGPEFDGSTTTTALTPKGTWETFLKSYTEQHLGTVTSIAISGSNGISVSGSPITDNGTIAIDLNLSTAINGLGEGTSPAQRDDYIVAQYAGGGTTTTTYHRRKLSNIFKALNSGDITTALGYTPYNSSNPNGYTSNAGTVTKVSTGTGLTGGDVTTSGTIKANLTSDTALSNAALTVSEDSNRIYPVRVDKNSKLVVVVPWTNVNSNYLTSGSTLNAANLSGTIPSSCYTNTTYSAGTGLSLSSTTFSVKLGYTTSGNNRAVQADSNGNLYVTQKDDNTTYNFSGTTFYSGNSGNAEHNANNALKNGNYYYSSNGPATTLGASTTDGALYVQSYSDTWVGQIAQDYRNGGLFVRGKNNGTWQDWQKVYDTAHKPTAADVGAAASGHTHSYLPLTGGTLSGDLLFSNSDTTTRQIRGVVGANDYWRIAGGATAGNAGWMEIATADDGNEPIYARQYTGAYTTIKRTLTLLDADGNSSFPGTVKIEKINSLNSNYQTINCDVSQAEVKAQNSSLTTSSADTDWFQALVKAICVKYPNISSTVFKGVLAPNSVRFYEIYIYNTATVDSTTKLPQHSFGRALNYGGGFTKFGTDSYTWRFGNVDSNTTYSLSSLGGIGTITASGTAPLTLSASKSGTTVTITGSVDLAWGNITDKPINFITNTGALNTNGWKTLGGRTSQKSIAISYASANPATWNSEAYSSSIVFGCSDTKGIVDVGYNSPIVTFGGGSVGGSTDAAPKWYFKLSGTSGQTYTFPSTSKTLVATDGTGASGTWGISITGSAGSVAWANVTGKPTIPGDTKVTQTVTTTNASYPILMAPNGQTATTTTTGYFSTTLNWNPNTKIFYVSSGTTTGNIYMGLATNDALYTAINNLGWVSSVIV